MILEKINHSSGGHAFGTAENFRRRNHCISEQMKVIRHQNISEKSKATREARFAECEAYKVFGVVSLKDGQAAVCDLSDVQAW
ncbi:MAG TPA: hypothetical protein VGV87_03490 [Blastocatellia bacterium]|nr:hypothetical protein [Blastocatellia bacterium]